MSILEELYNGNIDPSGKYIKNGSEYQSINNQLVGHIEALMDLLNDEQKQLCQEIEDDIYALEYISKKESFVEGFRTGAQMMWEIMNLKSKNFTD